MSKYLQSQSQSSNFDSSNKDQSIYYIVKRLIIKTKTNVRIW